jgi:nitrogen regulatory protein P-II 1
MKKVEAIIRPEKVNTVIRILEEAGYDDVAVHEVAVSGKLLGGIRFPRANQSDDVELRPKVLLVTIVENSDLDTITKLILDTAKTGSIIGDGKIYVTDISDVIDIRTEELREMAIR